MKLDIAAAEAPAIRPVATRPGPKSERGAPLEPCFHGGAFYEAIGEDFSNWDARRGIVNADVLDAWFDPAPGVLALLSDDIAWWIRTSPPARSGGLIAAIARSRGVPEAALLAGAGSSDLIFLALREWLTSRSRVLLPDPTYGEYAHVLERVIGCRVDRLILDRADNYRMRLPLWRGELAKGYDVAVLVNPNSPTGQHEDAGELRPFLESAPVGTRVWIDETYVDYAGPDQSLERFAAAHAPGNVVVCKSMSKVYALSGVRAAYLCGAPGAMERLRKVTPPWSVSLPAQMAAIRALEDGAYYRARYEETRELRERLSLELTRMGWSVVPGVANFLLAHLPERGPEAAAVLARCRERGLYLRDASTMGTSLGARAVRVAVKDAAANRRMVEILSEVLAEIARA